VNQAVPNLLDEVDKGQLRSLVDALGLAGCSDKLGVSRGVISSALAGINVRAGSLLQLKSALAGHRNGHGASK
jgi:hypothetical protein